MLKLRDAVALSLDFEPDSVSVEHHEFAHRLKVAVAHFRDRRILKLNMQTPTSNMQPALAQVWVPHFAAWARVKPKWHLPPELAAIAQPRLSAPARLQASAAQRRAVLAGSWQEAVRELAGELHLQDLQAGTRSSTRAIAERVAVAAARLSIRGPRGELSAQNILRAALQGDKWKRPKPRKAAGLLKGGGAKSRKAEAGKAGSNKVIMTKSKAAARR